MTKQYDKKFKENAVQYRYDHPELTVKECAKNMCVPYNMYHGWPSAHKNKGENAFRGLGNYFFGGAEGNSSFKARAARYAGRA